MIALLENYQYWKLFLEKINFELSKCGLIKFYVTDGKKGLHQALSELYPSISDPALHDAQTAADKPDNSPDPR